MFEKAALGFYLSGHLFDQSAQEVRQFAKVKIADLVDSRDPQLLAGIVGDLRVINGQRGRVDRAGKGSTRPIRRRPEVERDGDLGLGFGSLPVRQVSASSCYG